MGTIEQAAKRLEQLKKAGVDISTGTTEHLRAEAADGTIAEPLPLRVARELDARPVAPPLADARQSDVLHHVSVGIDPAAMPEGPALAGSPVRPVHPLRTAVARPHVDIDLARLSANGYVTPQSPRSRLAEEFRVIKRPLLVNARGKSATTLLNSNRIMVTSSTAGEGKTYVSINLALSLAMELETHVLLVDADATRPAVLDRLALPPAKGLLDLLVDPAASPDSLILSTNVDRLSILPGRHCAGAVNRTARRRRDEPPRRTTHSRGPATHRAVRCAAAARGLGISGARKPHGAGHIGDRGRRHVRRGPWPRRWRLSRIAR